VSLTVCGSLPHWYSFYSLFLHIESVVCVPSVLPVEKEREEDYSQLLKSSAEAITRLRDELRQAEDRERQLQTQMDETKEDVSQPQKKKKKSDDSK